MSAGAGSRRAGVSKFCREMAEWQWVVVSVGEFDKLHLRRDIDRTHRSYIPPPLYQGLINADGVHFL